MLASAWAVSALAKTEALVNEEYWAFWLKPEIELSEIGSEAVGIAGGQLGTSLGRSFYWGVGYYALISSVSIGDPEVADLGATDLWYAGAGLGYTFAPEKMIHGALDLFVGGGTAEADLDAGGSDRDNLLVVEPKISGMLNVTPDVEIGLGLGYRFVSGGEVADLSDSDLSGLTGSLFLRWTETR